MCVKCGVSASAGWPEFKLRWRSSSSTQASKQAATAAPTTHAFPLPCGSCPIPALTLALGQNAERAKNTQKGIGISMKAHAELRNQTINLCTLQQTEKKKRRKKG